MVQDFFTNLPTEITTDILSRLSIRSYATSKCVCKAWLNLLDSDDFDKSKLKTPPALVRFNFTKKNSIQCTIFEIEDEDEADLESHDPHYNRLTDLEIPHRKIKSMEVIAANGLLLLYSASTDDISHVCICNLITREYTELSCPEDHITNGCQLLFGFGVSKISGQYKVVRINLDTKSHYVYTLGIGTWRRVEAGAASGFTFWGRSIVCNGNLHWKVYNFNYMRICGFDVEMECFRIFSVPPGRDHDVGWDLCVLRDCLCYSYTCYSDVVIWMMKEYQVEDSWTIQYKLRNIRSYFDLDYMRRVHPIIYFKDGDILMLLEENGSIYYSNKTRTFQRVGMFDAAAHYLTAPIFTPSLFSLKNFGFENVISF